MGLITTLTAGALTLGDVRQYWQEGGRFVLNQQDIETVSRSALFVENCCFKHRVAYGINTGFGALASQVIAQEDLLKLQNKLILSHACGVGDSLDKACVGLMLLLKINSLSQGYSGVSVELIEKLLFLINEQYFPLVPSKGSVGASGDLAPLAHLVLPLIGEGFVRHHHEVLSGALYLKKIGQNPYQLKPKEGLALINGLQASTAILLDAFFKIERLMEASIIIGAMSLDAINGNLSAFDEKIARVRRVQGQIEIARVFNRLLHDSEFHQAKAKPKRVQDPYCIRCQPQVLGAILEILKTAAYHLTHDINAVTDNPLIFVDDNEILSGGNFHGELLGFVADSLALAISELGAISERRIALLVDNNMSGLPAFLVRDSGLNSGFMIAHVTAAACASDNKALSHPHSVDSLPTSANQEDHVSMATNAALRLSKMIENSAAILAIELMAASQALDLHAPHKTSSLLQRVKAKVRQEIAFLDEDRLLSQDILKAKEMILSGQIALSLLGLNPIDVYYTKV